MNKKKVFFKRKGKYILVAAIGAAGLGPSIWGLNHTTNKLNETVDAFENSPEFAIHRQIANNELAELHDTLDELKFKAETNETLKSACRSLENSINAKEQYYNSGSFVVDTLKESQDSTYYSDYISATTPQVFSLVSCVLSFGLLAGGPLVLNAWDGMQIIHKKKDDKDSTSIETDENKNEQEA